MMNKNTIRRLREIITIFAEEGFSYLIDEVKLSKYLPLSRRVRLRLRSTAKRPEEGLRRAFERLGPTFIKFGQLLSSRPDILPKEYLKELSRLQDKVRPVRFSEMEKVLKTELGSDYLKYFKEFNRKAVASASIAQVYKGKLNNGRNIAVKVQRPGIEEILKEDIGLIYSLISFLEKHFGFVKKKRVRAFVEEFERWTLREIDFDIERCQMDIFRENFRSTPKIIIPKNYPRLSTSRVLVMEYIDGIPLNDTRRLKEISSFREIILLGYEALLRMIFEFGLFHADPHPGNMLVIKKGRRLAFLDFGIVGRFDDELRKNTFIFFRALIRRDINGMADALIDIKTDDKKIDINELKRDFNYSLDSIRFEKLKDINIAHLINKSMDILYKYDISLPLEFVLYTKTIITMEGVALEFDPEFNLIASSKPIIQKISKREFSIKNIREKTHKKFNEISRNFERAPKQIMRTLEWLSSGSIGFNLNPEEFINFRRELEHSSGNIAFGFIIAALFVGSSLLVQTRIEPLIYGYPLLAVIGYISSLLLGIWLLKRSILTNER